MIQWDVIWLFSKKGSRERQKKNLFSIGFHGYIQPYSLYTFWGEIPTCSDALGLVNPIPSLPIRRENYEKIVLCSFLYDTGMSTEQQTCCWSHLVNVMAKHLYVTTWTWVFMRYCTTLAWNKHQYKPQVFKTEA